MGEQTAFTRSYFAPAPESPWILADGGQVLCWKTGATIAFLPEVRAVLLRVAREAEVVPPFLAVVLLLDALRQDPRSGLSAGRADWIRKELLAAESSLRTRLIALTSLAHLERGLAVLARIPAAFWARADAKALVAVAVFEAGSVRREPSHANLLARAIEGGHALWAGTPRSEITGRRIEVWTEAFSILLHGLARFDPEAFLLRARTGLEDLPAPAELEVRPHGGARELIEELRADEELADVAALARRLLATMHLPRPISRREDLPIGGVSDISNRGSFDRLLASELAHDDLTLAVRVALNEALYTRRESPPRPLGGARCVLVDTGIRMWGLPRVFAAAVALALAASSERGRPVRVWRPCAERLEPVDLTRREGLVSLLAALDSGPHPGASVDHFVAEVDAAGEGSEAFLVTHPRVLSDPGFRAAARILGEARAQVVQVDAAGQLRVEARSDRGGRTLQEARLDLASLLRWPVKKRPAPASAHELPAFLQVLPSPLLLPHDLQRCRLDAALDGTVLAWTQEQELAHWSQVGCAARVLARVPGPRRVWLFECTDEGVVHLVKTDERGHVVWLCHDLASGQSDARVVTREPRGLLAASRIGADLLLACHRESWWIEGSASGGTPRTTHLAAVWLGGRFFRTRAHALALLRLSPDGPSFEPLRVTLPAGAREVQSCFERTGQAGPWALAQYPGGIVSFALDSDERRLFQGPLPRHVRFTRSSRDGRRLLDHTGCWLMDFQTAWVGGCSPLQGLRAVVGQWQPPLRGFTMRTRIQAIGLGRNGQLVLADAQRKPLVFRQRGANGTRAIELVLAAQDEVVRLVAFERSELGEARITRVARSPRGDQALLDRRGLLHLIPADPREPQMAILLPIDRPTAIWCSDGRVHGPHCFTGTGGPRAEVDAMLALLHAFAEGFA